MLPALLSTVSKLNTLVSRLTSTRATNLDNLDAAITTRSTLTSAQAAAAVWAATPRTLTSISVTSIPSVIQSIQQINGDLNGTTLDRTITAVVTAKTVILFAGASGPSGGAVDFFPRATLLNSTTVRLTRGNTSGSTTQYSFFVVEFK